MKNPFSIILCILITSMASAQELEDYLGAYSDENAYSYLEPIPEVFASNMNSGWFRDAHINHMKFQFYIGLVTTSGLVKSNQRSFDAVSEYGGTVSAPTILGQNGAIRVSRPNGLAENYPGGIDVSVLPLAVPQASIGGLWGTEVTFRYFATDIGEEIGKLDLFGWGIRHSISQYFTDLPVDIAVGYYRQSFKMGSYIESDMALIMAQADYSTGILDFYGGVGYEMNTMDIEYITDEEENTTVMHSYDKNPIRFTAGINLNLGVFKLHGDYSLSNCSVFTLGMGLGFGTKNKE